MQEQKLSDAIERALKQASPLSHKVRQRLIALLSSSEVSRRD
jgi:hypothetical protein